MAKGSKKAQQQEEEEEEEEEEDEEECTFSLAQVNSRTTCLCPHLNSALTPAPALRRGRSDSEAPARQEEREPVFQARREQPS